MAEGNPSGEFQSIQPTAQSEWSVTADGGCKQWPGRPREDLAEVKAAPRNAEVAVAAKDTGAEVIPEAQQSRAENGKWHPSEGIYEGCRPSCPHIPLTKTNEQHPRRYVVVSILYLQTRGINDRICALYCFCVHRLMFARWPTAVLSRRNAKYCSTLGQMMPDALLN